MPKPLSREAFQAQTGVSRETLARLDAYIALLAAWNRRINLVAPASLEDVWRRHILDCAQLQPLLPPEANSVVDLGSGAGLPGLILAILGVAGMRLIEADTRKSAFLREAARVCGAAVTVEMRRIEEVPGFAAAAIVARALAPLGRLLDHAEPFIAPHSILLFLKGRAVEEELTDARKAWKMRATLHPSVSDPSGTVLRLEQVSRASHTGHA